MFFMYDSVNLDEIPAEPHAVASYINGRYANYEEAVKRFPRARHLRISVTGLVVADAYDIELGDYEPQDTPELYKFAHEHGVWRPCFYAQLSGIMPAVKTELNKVVEKREDIRLWVAYYNETPDLAANYDAHQFTCTALGRNLDESICQSDFFEPIVAKPAPVAETAKAIVTHNQDGWNIEPVK